MKNVLLLGDSIRQHYKAAVAEKLGSEYSVYGPEENCRFAAYTLNSLRNWLPSYPNPDIIHWNCGLWDTAIIYQEDGCFTPISEYVRNMLRILRELKKTGAVIIFATTTPCRDEKALFPGPEPTANRNEDIEAYNRAVLDAFRDEKLIINDLYSAIYEQRDKLILDDMIHPNEAGVATLADQVVSVIRACSEKESA